MSRVIVVINFTVENYMMQKFEELMGDPRPSQENTEPD